MISSNGLIIIEMVSSETVDRGTVLFILKGETCLNGIWGQRIFLVGKLSFKRIA